MGYWNETCEISSLPILTGEEVGAIILAKRQITMKQNGFCCADDVFRPITPIVWGNYNDYGGIEDVAAPQIEEALHAILAEEEVSFQIPHEGGRIENITPNVSLKWLLNTIARGEVTVTYPYPNKVAPMGDPRTEECQLVLIKKDMAEYAISCTKEYAKACQGDKPGTFTLNFALHLHPILRQFLKRKSNCLEVKQIEYFLGSLRRAWAPTGGKGSQSVFRSREYMNFYQFVADAAKEMYYNDMVD